MKKCIIVENKEIMRKVIKAQLTILSIDVVEASGGQKALDLCKQEVPDLIIVDWVMPIMDGLEFIQRFKASRYEKEPIIILYSAKLDEYNSDVAMNCGADYYIQKPVTLKDLQTVLEKFSII